jgi:hypothetical protein
MTQRERKTTVKTGPATTAVLEMPRSAPPADNGQPHTWEDFFRHMSPGQQDELLGLAGRQGLLYAHQLPAATNGKASVEQIGRWNHLNQLLAGGKRVWDPVRNEDPTFVDTGLDALQRRAVARALGTPDVALVAGWPGTGKSRVIAEIVTQAAQRGERVLFLAPHAAAVDHVLPQVMSRDAVCPVRLLDAGVALESVPAALRSLTACQRTQALTELALERARQAVDAAQARCARHGQEESLWPRLQEHIEQGEQLRRQRQQIQTRREQIPDTVTREWSEWLNGGPPPAFAKDLISDRAALQQKKDQQAAADKQREEAAKTAADVEPLLAAQRPLAEAKKHGRWWTWTWWRALFAGDALGKYAALENQQRDAQAAVTAAAQESQRLAKEHADLDQAYQRKVAEAQAAECERRLGELVAAESPLEKAAGDLQADWSRQTAQLDGAARPGGMSEADLDAARLAWQAIRQHDDEGLRFARQWSSYLHESSADLSERFLSLVNVVAGSIAAFTQDKQFGPASAVTFDLLVVEEADQITEADFLKLARRARRWVLVGEPTWEHLEAKVAPRPLLSTSILQKLWQQLHWDPRRLPSRWTWEGDRLCCQLRQVPADQRRWLEMERVADSPEIELRILSLPREAPALAEVVFPAGATLAQAKGFVYREMQEVPVQTSGRCAQVSEDDEHVIFKLADAATATPIALDHGIHEWVATEDQAHASGPRPSWSTCRFTFAKSAGWTQDTVLQWAEQHLHFRDVGRTTSLHFPYRMESPLADFLSDLLYAGGYARADASGPNGKPASVLFIPVPAPRRDDGRDKRKPAAKAVVLPREGAGLEQDLATARHGDRLPNDLRPHLPTKGIVNYLEAQAVVRTLEDLAGGHGCTESLAVLAVSAAQVELIRLLIRRSSSLTAMADRIEVGLPAAFVQREFNQVLVSLTRSHNHRAVSFGDHPGHLGLALTRARRRLFLFGDPGTLARRVQWQGRVEPLDDAASAHEAHLIGNLVRYLQGQGRHAHAFLADGLPSR